MHRHRRQVTFGLAGACALVQIGLGLGLAAQTPQGGAGAPAAPPNSPQRQRAADNAGLVITCEVFCSATKLRTGNVRIRWSAGPSAPPNAVAGAVRAAIETTVFYQGFEKNQYVSLPLGGAGGARPVAPPGAVPARQGPPLRAYELQIIQTDPPAPPADGGPPEAGVVIEGLEPGANYTWRVAVDANGRLVSPTVTCEAPVCPADMADQAPPPPPAPPRRP
jgi:hypothetical protein